MNSPFGDSNDRIPVYRSYHKMMQSKSDAINLLKIQAFKRRGDEGFASGNFRDAIADYSEAVDLLLTTPQPQEVHVGCSLPRASNGSGGHASIIQTDETNTTKRVVSAPVASESTISSESSTPAAVQPPLIHSARGGSLRGQSAAAKTTLELLPVILSNRSRAYCSAGRYAPPYKIRSSLYAYYYAYHKLRCF